MSETVEAAIERLDVSAYEVPTPAEESDATLEWKSTTIVVVRAYGSGESGLGYTYGHSAVAYLISDLLGPLIEGHNALDVGESWHAMLRACRNLGRPGLASHAISAVDTALWDLKARVLGVSLVDLLGAVRDEVRLYGSGGFTSYSDDELHDELARWARQGFAHVKMKVGRHGRERDVARVFLARKAVGDRVGLMVDANGAYTPAEALDAAPMLAGAGVEWFEEPVSSDDLEGLRFVRERAPTGMEIAAGEYGYDSKYFERMLEAGAVDVLQADATRCAGFTGFIEAAVLCEARGVELSAHTAPQLHAHVGCAIAPLKHVEWFEDHVRVEDLLFDGALEPVGGRLRPDRSRPGIGLDLKEADADPYAVWGPVDAARLRPRGP